MAGTTKTGKIKVCYIRVSSILQNVDRQRINDKDFDLIIEDRCSGTIPFFQRTGGKDIKKLVDQGRISSLSVLQIDRLGRNLNDLLNTIQYFTDHKVSISFTAQNLTTLDELGNELPMTKMVISFLGIVGHMEYNFIKERTLEGVRLGVLQGKFLGRKKGAIEGVSAFLNKERSKKTIEYLKKGYKSVEIAKIVGININTITKIKKLAQING